MKNLLLLIFLLPALAFAQKIEEDRTDEFTGTKIIGTSYEDLISTGSAWLKNSTTVKYRFVNRDGKFAMQIKMLYNQGEIFTIKEGADLMLKFDDGTVYTLNATESVVASEGGATTGAWGSALYGVNVYFISVDDPKFDQIVGKTLVGARIYIDEGYVEETEIKGKVAGVFSKSLDLVKGEG